MLAVLDQELETYEKHREELLGRAEGKYSLILGAEILGIFETKVDAIEQGFQRLGNVPFLVKQIQRVETPQNFVTNLLGI